jgi:hypothetical protein
LERFNAAILNAARHGFRRLRAVAEQCSITLGGSFRKHGTRPIEAVQGASRAE